MQLLLLVFVVAVSLLFAWGVITTEIVSLVGFVIVLALAAIALAPRFGVYAAFGLAIAFENESPDGLMAPGYYLNGGITGTLGVAGAVATPFELLLLFTCATWLFGGIARRDLRFRAGDLGWPMAAFALALVAGFLRGAFGGGDMYIGLFESRYLFYVPICYVLAVNTIRTIGQIRILTVIAFSASAFFAIEGAYRKVALIDTGVIRVAQELQYQHDDSVFLSTSILLVVAFFCFRTTRWLRAFGLAALPLLVFTMLASERRAGFIALFAGLALLALLVLAANRRAFALVVVPLLIGSALYLPVFWNADGLVGQPARAVRSIWQPDARDAASNDARVLEKINVTATIQSDPFLGVGFGRPYRFVVSVPDLSFWPLWHYIAHANVLWLWLKLGFAGFVAFWVLVAAASTRAAQLARTLAAPEVRSFAILSVLAIVTTLVFGYVDIAFTTWRVTAFLGITLGGLAVLEPVVRAEVAGRRPAHTSERSAAALAGFAPPHRTV